MSTPPKDFGPLSNGDLTRIAESVGMVRSFDGVLMRSIGHAGGMTAEHGFAFARAAISEDRARQAAAAPKPAGALDENIALREMAKHAHRALNAAAAILATIDEEELGDQRVADVEKRCTQIACSLFSLLRGNEVDRYESSPLETAALPLAGTRGAA
ncbi:MAG TPA: hypothetical protein VF453_06725 [Burkholderiaceae bacterium]